MPRNEFLDPEAATAATRGDASERRRKRSSDPVTALHYQLASVRRLAKLDAMVLVDDAGCLVAGAGAWPVCEELAAYAPLLVDRGRVIRRRVSARLDELSAHVDTLPFDALGQPLVMSCRGGPSSAPGLSPSEDRLIQREALAQAVEGVRRILLAA